MSFVLMDLIWAARRVSGRRTSGGAATRMETGVDTAAVRAWAASNGIELSTRGRVPKNVIPQYRDAGN